jgi:HPt (histidine-containing phosphotransfer) domain-containing protein
MDQQMSHEVLRINPVDNEMPVRDHQGALRAVNGDANLAEELLTAFVKELPPQYATICRLFRAQDWAELRETAHRLLGATAYCGVPALKQAARRLEQAARHRQDWQTISGYVDSLGYEIERLQALLANGGG